MTEKSREKRKRKRREFLIPQKNKRLAAENVISCIGSVAQKKTIFQGWHGGDKQLFCRSKRASGFQRAFIAGTFKHIAKVLF